MEESIASQSNSPLEWNGEAYHRLSDMQYEVAMEFASGLQFNDNDTLLDAGCGSGRITRELLPHLRHGKIIGVDLSASMLETARQVVIAQPGQEVSFIQANLQTYVDLKAVDCIFSSMALHFVHDHATLFANFAKTLRPGGWLAVQFGRTGIQHSRMATEMARVLGDTPYAPYLQATGFDFQGADVGDTEDHLRQAGFEDIQVSVHPLHFSGPWRDKMVEFFNSTMRKDCLARLPDALHARFNADMDKFMENAFEETFEYLRVRARLPQVN